MPCEFKWGNTGNWESDLVYEDLEPDTEYTVYCRIKAVEGESFASDEVSCVFEIKKDDDSKGIFDIIKQFVNKIFGGHVSRSAVLKAAAALTAATTVVSAVTVTVATIVNNSGVSDAIRLIETAMVLNVARYLMYGFGE